MNTKLIASCAPTDFAHLDGVLRAPCVLDADLIEIRVDSFKGNTSELSRFLREQPTTFVVTCRSNTQGGVSAASPIERAQYAADATKGTRSWIDFELCDWLRCADVRSLLQAAFRDSADDGRKLILSKHICEEGAANFEAVRREFEGLPPYALGKFAYTPRTINDSFAALDWMRGSTEPRIVIGMGSHGGWTRLLAPKLGAAAMYCSLTENEATAPGQFSLAQMLHRFRWRSIGPKTRVYGVIGDPVAHSLSPLVHNEWLDAADEDAVYLPLHVVDKKQVLQAFLTGVQARPWLGISGLSVTIPHKSRALDTPGVVADRHCETIGAANTLTFRNDAWLAYNTDCYASRESITYALCCGPQDLSRFSFDVLGTGGATAALVTALHDYGCTVTVYGRSRNRTRRLAAEFNCRPRAWSERMRRTGDIVVNGTPIGMWPHVNESPLPESALDGAQLVFDLIYNPLETKLLAAARARGIATLNGLDMFVRQAAAQYELWNSSMPNVARAVEALLAELQRTSDAT